jgi:hypothetical protein
MHAASGDALPRDEWLRITAEEYLDSFIPAGGAAIRFVVTDACRIAALGDRLLDEGARRGLIPVRIDAAHTRVHMAQDLFFAIARAVPWDDLLQRLVEDLFTSNGYAWPAPGQPVSMAEIAEAHGVAPTLLARSRDRWLSEEIWSDGRLAQDFRSAILRLCLGRLEPESGEAAATPPLMQWLRGELTAIGALRDSQIFTRINRQNAHAMLTSLCHWVRRAGASGLLVVLDLRQILRVGAVGAGEIRYAPAAVMDAYEVLRELIDDIDALPGLFMAVLADPALTGGDPRRVLDQYSALQMRIWPDVRPGTRQNPIAPLVWLGP